ncbi:MAG: hypothetical protein ABI999_18190 [Acidobacteriota bacterium]
MSVRTSYLLLFLLIFSGQVSSQTASDFERNYSSGVYYEMRPTILMSAEFDKNGQVCQVSLQANRTSKKENTDYLDAGELDPPELKEVFDELFPPSGREGEEKSMGFLLTGSMGFSAVFWENVRFNVMYSMAPRNQNRSKSNATLANEGPKKGLDMLFGFTLNNPALAYVTWTKRHCAEN